MTKSIILGAAMALALSTGAAMAQEGNAQNLFDGSPRVFNDFAHGAYATHPGTQFGGVGSGTYSVQSHRLSVAPDGGDGGAN